MNPISNHIAVKYHWFWWNFGKESVIQNIESENQKASKINKLDYLSVLENCYAVGKPSYDC